MVRLLQGRNGDAVKLAEDIKVSPDQTPSFSPADSYFCGKRTVAKYCQPI